MNTQIDAHALDVHAASMTTRIKRTYNLSPEAVSRVRDLSGREDLPTSQDGVVEMAIEHLYREIRDRDDADLWSRAAGDAPFLAEVRSISHEFAAAEGWPDE